MMALRACQCMGSVGDGRSNASTEQHRGKTVCSAALHMVISGLRKLLIHSMATAPSMASDLTRAERFVSV
jgi:hypothetical protein